MIAELLDLLFNKEENKEESFHKACMGTLSCGHSHLIYRHRGSKFAQKLL